MKNVTQLNNPRNEMYRFDLKGSKIARSTKNFDCSKALLFLKDKAEENQESINFRMPSVIRQSAIWSEMKDKANKIT